MKLRYSVGIATKIIFMVTLIVVSANGVVMYITTSLFREDSVERVLESNKDLAENLGERAFTLFQDSREKMTLMAQFALKAHGDPESLKAIQDILKRSDDIVAFTAYRFDDKGRALHQLTEVNQVSVAEFNLKLEALQTAAIGPVLDWHRKRADEFVVVNTGTALKAPVLSLSFVSQREVARKADGKPWTNEWLNGRWLFRADVRKDALSRLFGTKRHIGVFVVDAEGRLVAHSDPKRLADANAGVWMTTNRLVDKMRQEKTLDNYQMPFDDETGETYLGAYKKVGVGGLAVIAQMRQADALAALYKAQYRAGLFTITVVCFAILLNFALSHSLTKPLQLLFNATQHILEGKYDVKLRVRSSDEIGALAKAFLNMAAGLKEREKLKGAFNKFHSKEIAKKLLSGEIKLGGERRQATVFFSDIRGFTAISEKMSPDQVVLLLNEYMSEMVNIIYKWKGVVDKYMGDAIMAVWGVPESTPDDAYNAVRAALEMREFLIGWNQTRLAKGKVEVRIGIGLASGELLAGNIGSEHRLEYTVIGDTVNLASRIESACKVLKSDLLISHSTYTLVEHLGIVAGPAIHLKAKGKSEDVVIHQVIGYKDKNGVLQTPFSQDEISRIQSHAVTIEAESENKTQLAGQAQPVPSPFMSNENTPTPVAGPRSVAPYRDYEPAAPETVWFVVPDVTRRETMGPFTLKELALKVSAGQIDYNSAYVYENGKNQMLPLSQMMGLNRRREAPPVLNVDLPETVIREAAAPEEWYVHGHNGETLGPYTMIELELALSKGNLTRTTYVWKQGLANWIYLYQIPGFDRRNPKIA
ncbi:MAG TPA: adenylate/guanylate cyclase domain-containing protein [Bdellovibrionales bacterium]|nr:adenylate/guanylate cyclase domain-containing protein [Bdellovibrionales bacterium]